MDERRLSGSRAQSFAVTTKLYELFVSRSTSCFVSIVPFWTISKSPFSSPAVMMYSMRPLFPIKIYIDSQIGICFYNIMAIKCVVSINDLHNMLIRVLVVESIACTL